MQILNLVNSDIKYPDGKVKISLGNFNHKD